MYYSSRPKTITARRDRPISPPSPLITIEDTHALLGREVETGYKDYFMHIVRDTSSKTDVFTPMPMVLTLGRSDLGRYLSEVARA